jgi:hypothetical protein
MNVGRYLFRIPLSNLKFDLPLKFVLLECFKRTFCVPHSTFGYGPDGIPI